jgi:hypothetical protein
MSMILKRNRSRIHISCYKNPPYVDVSPYSPRSQFEHLDFRFGRHLAVSRSNKMMVEDERLNAQIGIEESIYGFHLWHQVHIKK